MLNVSRTYVLPFAIFAMSLYYIFFQHTMLFKLIPMVLIIMYGVLRLPNKRTAYHWLLLAGLAFCMLGDWSLQWFIIGLFSFLVGHLFYIGAFGQIKSKSAPRSVTIGLLIYGVIMASFLISSLVQSDKLVLIVPVLIYIIVISVMAWSACRTGQRSIIAGSLLFLISDSILAWNMFVHSVPLSGLLVMSTYYSAQFCFAYSLSLKK